MTTSKWIGMLLMRVGLFSLPGVLAWMVIYPNLRRDFLPVAAVVCVVLSVLSLALGAVIGAVVPRRDRGESARSRELDHQNGENR